MSNEGVQAARLTVLVKGGRDKVTSPFKSSPETCVFLSLKGSQFAYFYYAPVAACNSGTTQRPRPKGIQ